MRVIIFYFFLNYNNTRSMIIYSNTKYYYNIFVIKITEELVLTN